MNNMLKVCSLSSFPEIFMSIRLLFTFLIFMSELEQVDAISTQCSYSI